MMLQDRADAYALAFPHRAASHPRVVSEQGRPVLYGHWKCGQDYRNRSALYGAYPADYLVRVDLLPVRQPDVVADICRLPFPDASFDLAFADPPYSPADAEIYGTPMVNRRLA